MQAARPTFQSDFARPSALPTASLAPRNQQRNAELALDSDQYLERFEEEWNKKIDEHIQVLADNMVDLVDIARIGNKDQFRVAQEAFQTELKAESMVLAASSLLSLIHSLKLMLLLSDEQEIAERREDEMQKLKVDIERAQRLAISEWENLIGGSATEQAGSLS
ncbi:hypothetical protein FRC03_004179 [Tulasnella sp. 419]|nr:hypothetical protein FRC02_001789 [Tulasnella sp. 418]KAG8941695.1 hypothetical protein FRC03_004179 [Tulasnella sp. 419]